MHTPRIKNKLENFYSASFDEDRKKLNYFFGTRKISQKANFRLFDLGSNWLLTNVQRHVQDILRQLPNLRREIRIGQRRSDK